VTAWRVNPDQMHLIHAQLRGPADTVYSDGLFKVEVAVPPRYPFEPPRCRFLTRIHHPNIDSAGRICLDTLNMPPKGSWNPSSNLCTVLQTIQQLMSEPNPDDGLQADVTKQFREQRAVFDMQARSMTKQYAMPESKPAAAPVASTTETAAPSTSAAVATPATTTTPTPTDTSATPASDPSASTNKRRAEDESPATAGGSAAEGQQPAAKKTKLEDGTASAKQEESKEADTSAAQ
jgi:ubiquitin-protein ligase